MELPISQMKEAILEVAQSKGLTEEAVVDAIKEALRKAFLKSLGVLNPEDAIVEVDFDLEKGYLACRQLKKVVTEVTDDFLEIDIEEANVGRKKKDFFKEGDLYPIECPVEEMSKLFIKHVAGNLNAILRQAERSALYEIYKDHIGEMITGTVERCDDRSCFVNIGRTSVELTRRDMIGDEYFKAGDPIKLYIQEVKSAAKDEKASKGPQIEVTRSSEGFLKRLFEEEIHEVFEGTVIIKAIAREAGNRSKVAVASRVEDIDPTGTCIGQGGSRIQKIVNQLGNSSKDREKIDVIAWSANPGLFIAEALRPANVIGIVIEEQEEGERPSATAIVRDGQLSLAIGKKGANARLATKLTGWNIEVIEESIAIEDQIEYVSVEELHREAEEEVRLAQRALEAQEMIEKKAKAVSQDDITFSQKTETLEDNVEEPIIETTIVEEAAPAAKITEEPVKKTEPTVEVKTTKTLEDLEAEIEASKNKPVKPNNKKRPHKITEEEVEHAKPVTKPAPTFTMPIYSAEELADIEAEERELDAIDEYDDIDEDYDSDEYYED